MAGTNASATVQAPSDGIATLTNLLDLLGGQAKTSTTTQSPADISGLQNLMGQLQGADYNSLLQSIFQQAAGGIPQLQGTYSRAVGARSSNNSAVQASLNELLKQTAIEAQKNIVSQQLQNQQIQAQAGQAIAGATKGTTQTTKDTAGTNIGKATALLGLLSAAQKLTGKNFVQELMGSMSGAPAQTTQAADQAPVFQDAAVPAQTFAVPTSQAPMTFDTPVAETFPVSELTLPDLNLPVLDLPVMADLNLDMLKVPDWETQMYGTQLT
jgi:hypothetical protein